MVTIPDDLLDDVSRMDAISAASYLNEVTGRAPDPTPKTDLAIIERHGILTCRVVLQALYYLAESDPVAKSELTRFMTVGLDFSNETRRSLIGEMQSNGQIPSHVAGVLLSLGETAVSLASEAGLPKVTPEDVTFSRNMRAVGRWAMRVFNDVMMPAVNRGDSIERIKDLVQGAG